MDQKSITDNKAKPSVWVGEKSVKHLKTTAEASALDKKYRKQMWEDIAKGEQFVFGYGPLELFNSMGLYYVIPPSYVILCVFAAKYTSFSSAGFTRILEA